MCGRICQSSSIDDLFAALFERPPDGFKDAGGAPRYNIPPGTSPYTIECQTGVASASRTFWGYRPAWYDKAPVINARLDTIQKMSPFWRATLAKRVIIPVNGWYEWTGEKGDKQPWYIHASDGGVIFLAGVSGGDSGKELSPENGMAIITDNSAGGMVDIHDRRPATLPPDIARKWLDPNTSVRDAIRLLDSSIPATAFQWYEVTRRIGNASYQLADASTPIAR